jgi:hypothetical protein
MNAIEMAQAMETRAAIRRKITNRENTGDRLSDQLEQAATMLRQQQEELNHMRSFFGCDPAYYGMKTAEPVAYAMFRNGEYYDAIHPDEQAKTVGEYDIPLYLHPAKTLTDEEIIEVWRENERVYPLDRSRLLDRTRACIRKAQEK